MKMNGTVICVDKVKDRGELFVRALNDSNRDIRAYFFDCDVRNKDSFSKVLDSISKEIGDISILLNCSSTNVVSTYFDVSLYTDSEPYLIMLPKINRYSKPFYPSCKPITREHSFSSELWRPRPATLWFLCTTA